MDRVFGEVPTGKDRFGFDWTKKQGTWFWKGPHLSRKAFFRHAGAAVAGYFLLPGRPLENIGRAAANPIGKAKNCIFVLMNGGPSHIDTFDLKEGSWLPASFEPTSYGDVRWPRGLFPRMAEQMDSIALLRSFRSWTGVHELGRNWLQIGRNPIGAAGRIAPHIGSIVSMEYSTRSADKTLPAFFNLNANEGVGSGYFPPVHAPFYFSPGGNPPPGTTHPDGQPAFNRRSELLLDLDSEFRARTVLGSKGAEAAAFNDAARQLMYRTDIDALFRFTADERIRYGNSGFGNALLVARNLLASNKGTRFVQVNVGSWDNHANIYTGALNPTNANSLGRLFDAGMGALLADLKATGQLEDTLVVAMGEFGRTIGNPNTTVGRDHFLQQAALIAGAGIKGGRAIGRTFADGRDTEDPGWSRTRSIRTEDVAATIYSALGIDWTTMRYDDPTKRGFSYIPDVDQDLYGPIHDLWA